MIDYRILGRNSKIHNDRETRLLRLNLMYPSYKRKTKGGRNFEGTIIEWNTIDTSIRVLEFVNRFKCNLKKALRERKAAIQLTS